MREYERICKNINLQSIPSGNVFLKDSWSDKSSRDLREYNKKSDDLGIAVSYPEKTFVSESSDVEVCFFGTESGKFYGVLLADVENGNAGVGIWIESELNGEFSEKSSISLKENEIKPKESQSIVLTYLMYEVIFLIICFVILFYLFSRAKRGIE